MLLAESNCLRKCFLREVMVWEHARGQPIGPQLPVGAPLLAGCNKDESDQKSVANIYKSEHITSWRQKIDSACYMIQTK